MATWIEYHDDGTRTFHTSSAALYAAEMLDQTDAPELTQEQFEELAEEIRSVDDETRICKEDEDRGSGHGEGSA